MTERFVGRKVLGYKVRSGDPYTFSLNKHHGWGLEYLGKHGVSYYRDVNKEWLRLHPDATFMMSARLSELKTIGAIRQIGRSDANGDRAQLTGYGYDLLADWLEEKP